MKEVYRNTQRVNPFLAILPVTALLFGAALAIVFGEYNWILWTSLLMLGMALWMFSSLTVKVTPNTLRWHFGPGIFRWQCPLADVESASCEPDVAHWVWRWGIRIEPYGYLYSVSGGDTVRIRLKNGKVFGIRTDDANKFLSALCAAIEKHGEQDADDQLPARAESKA